MWGLTFDGTPRLTGKAEPSSDSRPEDGARRPSRPSVYLHEYAGATQPKPRPRRVSAPPPLRHKIHFESVSGLVNGFPFRRVGVAPVSCLCLLFIHGWRISASLPPVALRLVSKINPVIRAVIFVIARHCYQNLRLFFFFPQ